MDEKRLAHLVYEILLEIGENPEREGLLDTPERVARMYAELYSGLHDDPRIHLRKQFTAASDSMVVVKDIPFHSSCEHHLVPFSGRCHVGYIPGHHSSGVGYKIAGLSKFARVVHGYARRPQVQEILTEQICDAIEEELQPQGVVVVMKAAHLCMSMRGAAIEGSETITSAVRGLFSDNKDGVKSEFLTLLSLK